MKDQRDRLTPDLVDMILEAVRAPRTPPARLLWTAKAIGRRIGRSPDFVRLKLARLPGSPVHRVGGQWCCDEAALVAFVAGNRGA